MLGSGFTAKARRTPRNAKDFASIVVDDAISGTCLPGFSFPWAEGGVVRLDCSETAWDSFGLVLAAASGRLFADGPHRPRVFLVLQHSPLSFLQLVRLGSLSLFQQAPVLGALGDSVLIAIDGARSHGLYCLKLLVG